MGYLGYALQAGVEGFKSGFNMAQKKTEMEWQKKQKKILEEAQAKLEEEATMYNSVVAQLGADGFYSEDDMMKINTTYLALGYKTQDSLKNAHNALLTMDKTTYDREIEQLNSTTELLSSGLLDPKDASAVFEYGRENWATSEKIKSLYTAADNLYAKTHGAMKEEQTWERGATLPADVRTGYLRQEGVDIPEAEVTPGKVTFNEKRFNWKIDQLKAGNITTDQFLQSEGMRIAPEKKTALESEIDLMIKYGATNEEIKNKLLQKGGGGTTTPTSFKTLQTIKDSFKNVKTKAEYDEALASYNTSKEAKTSDWTPPSFEGQLTDLIKKVEGAIWSDYVDKSGKLKSKADAEEYNRNLQHYLKLIEEAKREGIDVSRFQAFIPYEKLYGGIGNPLVTSESW